MPENEDALGSYEVDYTHAPIGLFVVPFWVGSLLVGLFAFVLNCVVAKGIGAPYIVDGQRTFVKDDVHGVIDGVVVMGALFVLSLLLSLAGRAAVLKGQKIDGLWKIAWFGIPLFALVLSAVAVFSYH